jgi:hypothetical protein
MSAMIFNGMVFIPVSVTIDVLFTIIISGTYAQAHTCTL